MNILEWALDGNAPGNYFDRVDGGWRIETEKLPGGYANGCLSDVVEYFKEDLGLVPGCHRFEECGHCCKPSWHGEVSDELLEKVFGRIEVRDEADGIHWDGEARAPYFQLRGRRLSEEEAFEMIARTDRMFDLSGAWDFPRDGQHMSIAAKWDSMIRKKGYRGSDSYFVNEYIFPGNSIPSGGYVWPDGRVGINHWMYKLPDISEIIKQLMDWALCFPYFDIILVITKWNEISAQRARANFWEDDENYDGVPHPDADLDEYEKPYEPITVDDVDICIGIQPGILRFLKPEDGLRQLAEYDSFYTERERREFPTTDFYQDTHTIPIDEAYFSRLLNYYGEVPEEIREYLLRKFRKSTRK